MELFKVIDSVTGKEANPREIVEQEDFADKLVWCNSYKFYIGVDGCLVLADEVGNFVFCDRERFKIVLDTNVWFSVEERLRNLENEIEELSEYIRNAGTLYFVI